MHRCLTACLLFLTRSQSHLGQRTASQIASCWSIIGCLLARDTPVAPQDHQCTNSKPSFWIRKSPQQWHCKAWTGAQSPGNRQGCFQKQSDRAHHPNSRSLDLYHSGCFQTGPEISHLQGKMSQNQTLNNCERARFEMSELHQLSSLVWPIVWRTWGHFCAYCHSSPLLPKQIWNWYRSDWAHLFKNSNLR